MGFKNNDGASRHPLDSIVMQPCCVEIEVTKLCGGGTMWYYAMCKCGKILGASREDDRKGMERLIEIKQCSKEVRDGGNSPWMQADGI